MTDYVRPDVLSWIEEGIKHAEEIRSPRAKGMREELELMKSGTEDGRSCFEFYSGVYDTMKASEKRAKERFGLEANLAVQG